METVRIAATLGGAMVVFGLIMVVAFRLRGRAKRLYRARFLALGPGRMTEAPSGLRYACTWQGRDWHLELAAPMKLARTSQLTRDQTPRVIAQVQLTRPAAFGLHVVARGSGLTPTTKLRFEERPAPGGLEKFHVAASSEVTSLLSPEAVAAIRRVYDVPIVDLELEVLPGGRALTCTKLYGVRDLPAWLAAITELAGAVERAG